jgi:predicted transcriptional regulator of viral defense system
LSADRYAQLERLGVRTVTTAQAAATWRISTTAASKALSRLAAAGLIVRLRRGVWLLDREATAESLATEVVAPYPSYVSHVSALHSHGVIDQVPAEMHVVAAAAEPRRIETGRGVFRVHRIPPALFGGYTTDGTTSLASVEKALFDWAYLSVVSGRSDARLPETEWPSGFRRGEIERWLRRIDVPRIRTLTRSLIARRLDSIP